MHRIDKGGKNAWPAIMLGGDQWKDSAILNRIRKHLSLIYLGIPKITFQEHTPSPND